jgi:polyhydroxyalkanoate synthesis regulator phasin
MPQPAKTTSASEQLRRVLDPLDLVIITRVRLQEVVDDAVERGRMTRGDAADLVTDVLARGRGQADDLLAELEQLLGRPPLDAARRATGLGP